MTDRKNQMLQDRYLRDSARALVDADIENVKSSLSIKSVGSRAVDRAKHTAQDMYDEAVDVAEHNKGTIIAIVAAMLVWFARNPILSFLGFNDDGGASDETPEMDDE